MRVVERKTIGGIAATGAIRLYPADHLTVKALSAATGIRMQDLASEAVNLLIKQYPEHRDAINAMLNNHPEFQPAK